MKMSNKLNSFLLIFLIQITLEIQIKTLKKYEKAEITETDTSIKEMIFFLELKDFKLDNTLHLKIKAKGFVDFYYAFTESNTEESFNNVESIELTINDFKQDITDGTYYKIVLKKKKKKIFRI